jgi:hypothetical protein
VVSRAGDVVVERGKRSTVRYLGIEVDDAPAIAPSRWMSEIPGQSGLSLPICLEPSLPQKDACGRLSDYFVRECKQPLAVAVQSI